MNQQFPYTIRQGDDGLCEIGLGLGGLRITSFSGLNYNVRVGLGLVQLEITEANGPESSIFITIRDNPLRIEMTGDPGAMSYATQVTPAIRTRFVLFLNDLRDLM